MGRPLFNLCAGALDPRYEVLDSILLIYFRLVYDLDLEEVHNPKRALTRLKESDANSNV